MALPLDVLLHIKCQTSHDLEKGLIELTRLSKSDRFFVFLVIIFWKMATYLYTPTYYQMVFPTITKVA